MRLSEDEKVELGNLCEISKLEASNDKFGMDNA